MSSGGKGGSSQPSLNYYGTLAGAISWGPLDWLVALINNGNYLFKNDAGLDLTADVTDLTGSLLDPSMLAPGGYVKLYRGTTTQPADAGLPGFPPHKDTAWLVARNLFFGQDSGVAPNWQVIAGRRPRVPTTIVAAEDNIVDDRQVNPIACFAELLLDERGWGYSEERLDAATWLAAAHWCAQDQAHRDYTFVSPLITDALPLRDLAKQLLEPFSGFLRWTREGKLACLIYEWGVDPGDLLTLDAQSWVKRPKTKLADWVDVPTEVVVSYTDRAYQFQSNSVPVPNPAAYLARQVDDSRQLERKHVMRRKQAQQQGAEFLLRAGAIASTGTLQCRGPLVADLLPGDKIKVDVDPEPGGDGLAQLCRVKKITRDSTDRATIEVMLDTLADAQAYTPAWTEPPAPPDAECPPIAHALALALPVTAWGWPPKVAFLAARPNGSIVGFRVLFSDDPEAVFHELGWQHGFAVRATLENNITAPDTLANLSLTDGVGGPDANLAANTPAGNFAEAADDTLLAIFALLDSYGRVFIDEDGLPAMEICSIKSRAAADPGVYTYTLLRGRRGTIARGWDTTETAVWIVPRANLDEWSHELFASLGGAVGSFRLVAFTDEASDESDPPPSADLDFPAITPALVAPIHAFVFIASDTLPDPPEGGSYADRIPAGWAAAPSSVGTWWVSQRLFTYDGVGQDAAWSDPARITGEDGAAGEDGDYADYIFKRNATQPATPTGDTPAGWSDGPPAGSDPLWMSIGYKTAAGALIGVWSTPVRLDGAAGDPGADGISVETRYKRAASAPATPTGDDPAGWTTAPPAGSDPLWMSTNYRYSDGSITGAWSTPARITGEQGPPGADGASGATVGTASQGPTSITNSGYVETVLVSLTKTTAAALIHAHCALSNTAGADRTCDIVLYRDGSPIATRTITVGSSSSGEVAFDFTDTPAAGSHTYEVRTLGDTDHTPDADLSANTDITIIG